MGVESKECDLAKSRATRRCSIVVRCTPSARTVELRNRNRKRAGLWRSAHFGGAWLPDTSTLLSTRSCRVIRSTSAAHGCLRPSTERVEGYPITGPRGPCSAGARRVKASLRERGTRTASRPNRGRARGRCSNRTHADPPKLQPHARTHAAASRFARCARRRRCGYLLIVGPRSRRFTTIVG